MTDPHDAPVPGPEGAPPARALRLKAVGCDVLARPLYACAAASPHVVDVGLLRRGLHDTPASLRDRLQAEIDAAGNGDRPFDAVVLAYGLCGGATAGIRAHGVPLVLPRAHDCITLLLGSRERYARELAATPGTYWYAPDYVERSDPATDAASRALLGIGASSDEQLVAVYADYVERFGKDNADYLMEVMGAWKAHYQRAVFIDTGLGDPARVEALARAEAERRGWLFERMVGQLDLLRRLLAGDWDHDFLVLRPGQELGMTYDEDVMRTVDTRDPSGVVAQPDPSDGPAR